MEIPLLRGISKFSKSRILTQRIDSFKFSSACAQMVLPVVRRAQRMCRTTGPGVYQPRFTPRELVPLVLRRWRLRRWRS